MRLRFSRFGIQGISKGAIKIGGQVDVDARYLERATVFGAGAVRYPSAEQLAEDIETYCPRPQRDSQNPFTFQGHRSPSFM